MMQRLFAFSLLLFLLAGCRDSRDLAPDIPLSTVKMRFTTSYDGQDVEKYKNYDYNGYPLHFTTFTLYVCDIILLKDTQQVKLSDVEFLDFTPNGSPTNLAEVIEYAYDSIPPGDYTGLRIGYGVRPDYNALSPGYFPVGHPLFREQEYWLGWKSYIFAKIEGAGDANNNGQFDHFLVYHCGGDPVYKVVDHPIALSVPEGETTIHLNIDLKKVFTNADGTLFNMPNDPATSNDPTKLGVADYIMSNFGKATTIHQ